MRFWRSRAHTRSEGAEVLCFQGANAENLFLKSVNEKGCFGGAARK
jgi:hypothetical protein